MDELQTCRLCHETIRASRGVPLCEGCGGTAKRVELIPVDLISFGDLPAFSKMNIVLVALALTVTAFLAGLSVNVAGCLRVNHEASYIGPAVP